MLSSKQCQCAPPEVSLGLPNLPAMPAGASGQVLAQKEQARAMHLKLQPVIGSAYLAICINKKNSVKN